MGVPRYSLALSAGPALGPLRGPTLPPPPTPPPKDNEETGSEGRGRVGRVSEEGEREK